VKVPVKTKLAKTQQQPSKYGRKTRSQLVWRPENLGTSASENASKGATRKTLSENL
jgi:hypothetical protein